MNISIRRARGDDVEFLVELVSHEDVQPFLGAVSAREPGSVAAEVERSERKPREFGRFMIEVDGEPAGAMGFEVANRRSRIARLERLAVRPRFRGRRIADEAARLLQRHLLLELGFHRLELEIYGFNERAIHHSERSGFVREGVKRQAYWRHGEWVDGVLYSVIREDLGPVTPLELFHEHVARFNAAVGTGEFGPMVAGFTDDAEMAFEGVPLGPFHGREAIAVAYRERPPDDELVVLDAVEEKGVVVARYAWAQEPDRMAGRMRLTPEGDLISKLVVTLRGRLSREGYRLPPGRSRGRTIAHDALPAHEVPDHRPREEPYVLRGAWVGGFASEFPIVRDGELEATNSFFGVPGQEEELELMFNHGGRTYAMGTAYGHIALAVDDLDGTLASPAAQRTFQSQRKGTSETVGGEAQPARVGGFLQPA